MADAREEIMVFRDADDFDTPEPSPLFESPSPRSTVSDRSRAPSEISDMSEYEQDVDVVLEALESLFLQATYLQLHCLDSADHCLARSV